MRAAIKEVPTLWQPSRVKLATKPATLFTGSLFLILKLGEEARVNQKKLQVLTSAMKLSEIFELPH